MDVKDIVTLIVSLGIPGALFGAMHKWVKTVRAENAAVREGVQALLRAQMIDDYNHYQEKGCAPIYARDNFENCWTRYHALGANGVMDDIHAKFMSLPVREA